MDHFIIEGGKPLFGSVRVHGSKNAALPILAATVLADGEYEILDVPELLDIDVMSQILQALGIKVSQESNCITLDTSTIDSLHIPDDLMGQMRSSIFLMGPLLTRFKEVSLSRPGGCAIGARPIDLHLSGLKALGAEIEEYGGLLKCRTKQLKGNTVILDYPSVGATENVMMAATLADGVTEIIGAAKEPEIVDLQNFLNCMGARIRGAGTDTITIHGVEKLHPVSYTVIPDRIVAGTLSIATAITGGEVLLENVEPDHLKSVLQCLRQTGAEVRAGEDFLHVKRSGPIKSIPKLVTAPYPGFPTDMQAQMMALMTLAEGTSIVSETVFDGRFKHVNELLRMGADIVVDLHSAFVRGIPHLTGAFVEATDLRAGAALILAGMAAEGTTIVQQIHHIDRGYERIENMLTQLGAKIERVNHHRYATTRDLLH